ncbi:uncharacterized protein LTR77_003838 [Saxophila tyrrhenica]|uniref:Uncharacterized protein n=1 Tax=Saxophila tyrrhenica TaxID=1690608 RepID=A0AAV9PET4_9PEZI|nr:hypothetical protein LTR77_003838 [Saxophila tyrrhenica]
MSSAQKRHLKYDESLPQRSYCHRRRLLCEYPLPSKPSNNADDAGTDTTAHAYDGNEAIKAKVLEILTQEGVPCPNTPWPSHRRPNALVLIDHFLTPTLTPWIGSALAQITMQAYALRLAMEAPYLLHTILAFFATHLSCLYPSEEKWSVAATMRYSLSLTQYLGRLIEQSLGPGDADAISTAAVLHTMLASIHESRRTKASPSESRFCSAWLLSFQGTQLLLERTELRAALEQGIWADTIAAQSVPEPMLTLQHPELSAINRANLEALRTLQSVIPLTAPQHQHTYAHPLQLLPTLLSLTNTTTCDAVSTFITFISHLPLAYNYLLEAGEPEALLILGFWSALLSRLDV